MRRYKIWNRTDPIIIPKPDKNGKQVFQPDEFADYFPLAGVPGIQIVLADGEINGSFIDSVGAVAGFLRLQDVDLPEAATAEEVAAAYGDWENRKAAEATEAAAEQAARDLEMHQAQVAACQAQEAQAAAIEFQTLLMM